MSYAESKDNLDIELQTGLVAQDISDNDVALSTTGGDGITLISPANGEVDVAVTTQFEWDSTTAYDGYKLVFADNQALTNPTEYYITGKTFTVPVDLSASTTYYWKVVGGDAVSNTPLVGQGGFTGMTVWDAQTDPAPIYVYDQAAPLVLEGANDLADYIAESSGKTRPDPIPVSDSFNFPSRCIKVGFPNSLTGTGEIQIKCIDGGPIELTGVDEFDPNNPDYINVQEFYTETESNFMSQAGSYHSVMTFIQDYIDVVWGWAGPIGEAVPSKSELKVSTVDTTHTPSALSRSFLGFSKPGGRSPYGISKEWIKKQRGFYSLVVSAGHGFTDYYDRFSSAQGGTQDEIFAVQPDGSQGQFPTGRFAKMEVGRTDIDPVWEQVNVTEALSDNPLLPVFNAAFNDAHPTGHSVSDESKALDYNEPDAVRYAAKYENSTIDSPVITDRELSFAKRLADRVIPSYPDKYVSILAYGPSRPAPKREADDSRIIIVNTANDFNNPNEMSAYGQTHRENMDDWLSVWGNQVWRPNLGNGHGHQRGMWFTHAYAIGNRLKTIIPQGTIGLTGDQFWEHLSTHWPLYYTISQLLWDSSKTVDEILNKAYNTLFGDAADDIKAYYDKTEEVIVNNPFQNISFAETPEVWTNTVVSILQGHIDAAKGAVAQGTDEYLRVEFVEAGFEWSKAVIRACNFWIQYNAPAVAFGETDVTTAANAIESDVDATTGWTRIYGTTDPVSQASDESDFNFSFLLDANNADCQGIVRDTNLPDGGLASGTATGGTVNTLTDTGQSFTTDEFANKLLKITGGTNAGQERKIISNTADTITVNKDFEFAVDSTSVYEVTTFYLATFKAKHSGVGGQWILDNRTTPDKRVSISPEDTELTTYTGAFYGGDQLRFRELNDANDGAITVYDLEVLEAEPVDQDQIEIDWLANNSAAKDELGTLVGSDFVYIDKWADSPPIGEAVLRDTGRLPEPGSGFSEPDEDLI